MKTVTVPVIKTDKDHAAAVKQIERLWGAKSSSKDGQTLDVLLTLVDAYETKHFPIDTPDPLEAILFRMDQQGYGRRDLENLIGRKLVPDKEALEIVLVAAESFITIIEDYPQEADAVAKYKAAIAKLYAEITDTFDQVST